MDYFNSMRGRFEGIKICLPDLTGGLYPKPSPPDQSKIAVAELSLKSAVYELTCLNEPGFKTIDFEDANNTPTINWVCSAAGCPNPATKRCSSCKWRKYCSESCQAAHWLVHKQECAMAIEDHLEQKWNKRTLTLAQALVTLAICSSSCCFRCIAVQTGTRKTSFLHPSFASSLTNQLGHFWFNKARLMPTKSKHGNMHRHTRESSSFGVLLKRGFRDCGKQDVWSSLLSSGFASHFFDQKDPENLGPLVQTLLERGANSEDVQSGGFRYQWPVVLRFVEDSNVGPTRDDRSKVIARALIGARRNFDQIVRTTLKEWLSEPLINAIILPFCVSRWFCP